MRDAVLEHVSPPAAAVFSAIGRDGQSTGSYAGGNSEAHVATNATWFILVRNNSSEVDHNLRARLVYWPLTHCSQIA